MCAVGGFVVIGPVIGSVLRVCCRWGRYVHLQQAGRETLSVGVQAEGTGDAAVEGVVEDELEGVEGRDLVAVDRAWGGGRESGRVCGRG